MDAESHSVAEEPPQNDILDFSTNRYVQLEDIRELLPLFGHNDEHLKSIERTTKARVVARGCSVKITGTQDIVDKTYRIIQEMLAIIRQGAHLSKHEVSHILKTINSMPMKEVVNNSSIGKLLLDGIDVPSKRKVVHPKSNGQKIYVETIRKNDMVFGIGPAGTGKTYLAMACAINSLEKREVERIILTRPAVEAGESLGFLPGDMYEKVNPFLRPLYDALHDLMDPQRIQRYIERDTIEVAPLAYMRGRTLNDSFIILDEAQNTTPEQLKMFLTRLGFNSKTVITGDITQIDLEPGRKSGLVEVQNVLKNIRGIEFIYLTRDDVVRHDLVQAVIDAYEKAEMNKHL